MKKIGIAFGGGGARGLAHISMIEAFEELGLKPSIISGTSIGAITGAFYAAGFSSKEMKAMLKRLLFPRNDKPFDFLWKSDFVKMFSMFDPQFFNSGLMKGDRFYKFLETELGATTFEELKTPLKIVATDYWNKEEVIFDEGDLLPAIRASYSLPGLLTPVKIKKRILIDGGVVNPIPFDILLNECDITVAIDITAYRTSNGKEYPPTFESVFTTYQTMQNSINQQKMKFIKPDIYIRPEIYDVRVFDFSKHESIFKQSETAKDNLKRKLEKLLTIEPEAEMLK
ncbi:MAG TPA: patatin-like phospholipase family protein [Ignavibacteriaceae bacterium]|nr:patatin-like phospholipase family protein [Ignavibacteriaceae bacterium]